MPMHGKSGTKAEIVDSGPVVSPQTRTFEPDIILKKACIEHLRKTVPQVHTCFYLVTYMYFISLYWYFDTWIVFNVFPEYESRLKSFCILNPSININIYIVQTLNLNILVLLTLMSFLSRIYY